MASSARIFHAYRGFLALAAAVCVFVMAMPAAMAQGWQTTKIEGRDYVSIESVKKFYGFQTAEKKGNSIVLKSVNGKNGILMQLQIGSQECLLNKVKFIFTHNVEPGGTLGLMSQMDLIKLIEPVLRPNFIPNAGDFRTVILDAGHGGKDPGATNPLGTEANYNLTLAGKVKTLLEKQGFKVILTRTSDRYYSLQERVEIANAVKENAIFISLHFNSGGRDARGIETFTLSPPGVAHYGAGVKSSDAFARRGNEHDSANIALATAVHGSILRELRENTFDRGIKRARFSVLSGIRHPAILFEGGFMSHPFEARLIANVKYLDALANGISTAIRKYQFAVTRTPVAKPNP
ncbi:MAG: N-acetylmuramoyl-L-alanine amidase [Verrucomicrobiaceae bacterium]|nr:MAG: N-acetylmuramoyl-L-alanine amidase [Verrucomicrobiaceae bacterium]